MGSDLIATSLSQDNIEVSHFYSSSLTIMEEFGSIWSYQENVDELKHKLLYTTVELQALKVEAGEEIRKQKEEMNKLINLLNQAYQERDEAKNQLQKFQNKFMPSSPPELPTIFPQPDNSLVMPTTNANSSITESSSHSDTYNNHHSYNSSPVDSFFDGVTSPDFTSINMADSTQMGFGNKSHVIQDYNGSAPYGCMFNAAAKLDSGDVIINNLVKGKVLPQTGKLLQAVLEAGPLLQTLLVAGPLPRWRNPPPLQPFKIPPVSIKGRETVDVNSQKQAANSSFAAKKLPISPSYVEMSRGLPQLCSASMLNFTSGSSGLNSNGWLCSGVVNQIPPGKRQRLQ